MTIKGGTNKACAACKYQRRRCSKECPLAPYFPADQPKKFSNAHRLFGVSNIMRILNQVEPKLRDEAMKSIIFESDMRAQYPVKGCLGIICIYQNQILQAMKDLSCVKMRIAVYKEFHYQHTNIPDPISLSPPDCYGTSQLHFGDTYPIYNHFQHTNANEIEVFDGDGVYGNTCIENDDMKPWIHHQPYGNGMINNVNIAMANHQELDILPDYDYIPYDAIADDTQSFIEGKDACESSAESSSKQHIQHVSKNELKNATTACFTLTSVKGG